MSFLKDIFGGQKQLHKAAESQNLEQLRFQVQNDPKHLNATDGRGWTPLHIAADKGFEAGVRELLTRMCDPNIPDKDGCTALHIAVDRGHRRVVRDLVERGANTSAKDKSGRTPYDYAISRHPSLADALHGQPHSSPMMRERVPSVDMPSSVSARCLLPPAPLPSQVAPVSGGCGGVGGGGGGFPIVRHELTPPDTLLQPPPPTSPWSSHLQSHSPMPYPPSTSAYCRPAYGTQAPAAPQATEQRHTLHPPRHHEPPPSQQQQQLSPASYLPYPSLNEAAVQPPPGAAAGSRTVEPGARAAVSPVQPPHSQQPLVPAQPNQGLLPRPWSSLPAPSPSGTGGCMSAGGTEGTEQVPRLSTAATDLDWGPKDHTDWGDESEPLSPPPVLSQLNFNPIMSARYQLQRLLGAGLSQIGLGPRDRATSSHGGGSVGGAEPRVNTVLAAATPTAFQPHSSPDPAAIVSSPVSAGSTICVGSSRTYTYQELQAATNDFSSQNKLGRGGYGTVYCGWLDGISVAVKVMDTSESCMQGRLQFEREVNILTSVHHPNVVMLIGSCPNKGILVYELMPKGSLEGRLFGSGEDADTTGGKAGSQANADGGLSWRDRVRISWEISCALLFLHTAPTPIVHMDLKPANILLDNHLKAKLGDVGLARLAPTLARPAGSTAAIIQDSDSGTCGPVSTVMGSRLVGTPEYMDPEYTATGEYSFSSDVYALGVVMLQMLTGRRGRKVIAYVSDKRHDPLAFSTCTDARAGGWPVAEAAAFADLALGCTSPSRKDRPDLRTTILPTLMQLTQRTQLYNHDQHSKPGLHMQQQQEAVPPHFICPITHEVMNEPVVAADGYTYEKAAIEEWIHRRPMSPMTNLHLANVDLMENLTLRSAIQEWSAQQKRKRTPVKA